jgi:hypothetical protein
MPNVVPFPKLPPKHTVEVRHCVRRAVLLLDIALQQTRHVIETCPNSDKRDDLHRNLQELGILLDMVRVSAQTMFPNLDRHYD